MAGLVIIVSYLREVRRNGSDISGLHICLNYGQSIHHAGSNPPSLAEADRRQRLARPPFDVIEQLPGGAGGAFCIAAGNAREKSSDPVPVELEDKAFAAQSNCPESAIVIEGDDEA